MHKLINVSRMPNKGLKAAARARNKRIIAGRKAAATRKRRYGTGTRRVVRRVVYI